MCRDLSLVVAVTILGVSASTLDANEFCLAQDGKTSLNFSIEPSLIVHDAGTLGTTFNDLDPVNGDNKRVFSFDRTIETILSSAGVPHAEAHRRAFVQQLLNTFLNPNTVTLGDGLSPDPVHAAVLPLSHIVVPFDDRPGEAGLDPAILLDDTSPQGMVPVALVNRFDLAPQNWENCGEQRIVYGSVSSAPPGKFFLIFEGSVQNPAFVNGNEQLSKAGCRGVAEFWARLSSVAGATQRAEQLANFFYQGNTGSGGSTGPIVHFGNYGGDGGRGQIRGNIFIQGDWQLREWLTQITFDSGIPELAFVPETVKSNPVAELYADDLSNNLKRFNLSSAADAFQSQYVNEFSTVVFDALNVERTAQYQDQLLELENFVGLDVDWRDVLLSSLALGSGPLFDELQSTSDGSDSPREIAAGGTRFRTLARLLMSSAFPGSLSDAGVILMNRAEAMSCAGCHNSSHDQKVANTGNEVVNWPNSLDGFLHIDERGSLSDALVDVFLPYRRFLLGLFLCGETEIAQTVPPAPGVLRQAISTSLNKIDPVKWNADTLGKLDLTQLIEETAKLDKTQRADVERFARNSLRSARIQEAAQAGAFVPVRRPH